MRAENRTPGQATSRQSPSRKPLDAASLRRAVLRPGGLWQAVEVVDRTGSTNADLLARALAARRKAWCSPPRSRARDAAGWAAPGCPRRAPR